MSDQTLAEQHAQAAAYLGWLYGSPPLDRLPALDPNGGTSGLHSGGGVGCGGAGVGANDG
jgi:hypothetical protein